MYTLAHTCFCIIIKQLFSFIIICIRRPRASAVERRGQAIHAQIHIRVAINRLPCRRRARSFTGHKSSVFYHNERCAFSLLLLLLFLFVTSVDGGHCFDRIHILYIHETYNIIIFYISTQHLLMYTMHILYCTVVCNSIRYILHVHTSIII